MFDRDVGGGASWYIFSLFHSDKQNRVSLIHCPEKGIPIGREGVAT
nr:MAG TPA: hypothetical protein [Caudoviricetes sp.]